jgi:surfeit locus 1 family protein
MARQFRPKKIPTLIALAMSLALISLGTWQVRRLHEKEELLLTIHARMAQKPAPLPEKIEDPEAWNYRRVTMAGRFLYAHEFLVKPRMLDGQVGYHEYVPFRRASGGVVLVNRGWISDALLKQETKPQGIVQVEGIAQAPRKAKFTPENDPAKNDWYWPDAAAMARAANLQAPAPVIVSVAARQEGVYPAGGQVRIDIPNDHKQYAVFWYAMSLLLLGVWFVAHWEEE